MRYAKASVLGVSNIVSKYKTPRGTARRNRRLMESHFRFRALHENRLDAANKFFHVWDEYGVCGVCGFDGAEWAHMRKYSSDPSPMAQCRA